MQNIKIILVEDDEDDYAIFKHVLEKVTYNTTLQRVTDYDELIDHLTDCEQDQPDILFLDMNLPKKNGIEILTELQDKHRLNDIIVAIYSTTYMENNAHKLYELGADFYITKPVKFDDMRRVIESALNTTFNEDTKYVRSMDTYRIF